MKKIVFILSLLACQATVFAQLGVGTNSPDASAQLDVTATDKGFLAPRIALTSGTDVTTIASPATGLMVYNTATAGTAPSDVTPGYYYFDGVKWVRFINSQPTATISFSTTDPNTGTPTFSPNTPQNSGYIYVSSVNSSLWVWNGTSYVTYTTPASTPFYLDGTTTDAGGDKLSTIYRIGRVGIGSSNPYAQLDVKGNIYTTVHANSNLHDTGEQISRFIGHKSGNSSDGFSGMENEIGNYGNTGQSNGSKIHFLTWSNNLSASRRVATISQYGYFGIDNTAPAINLSVGSTNLSQKMGRAIVNANNQHHSDKRDAFQIGRWDGTSAHDDYFTGIKYNVTAGATVGETWDNQSFLTFFTWGSNISVSREVMRLDQRGRLGIGTSSPSAPLEVANTGVGVLIRRASTSLAASNVILQKSASSDPAVNTALANGDYVGRILFSAGNGTNYPLNGTDIVGYAVGAQTTTNNGGGMFFRTVPQNSVSQSIERMRIEHNGNVGIGTTAPTTNLDVVGGFHLRNTTGAAGSNYGIELNTNSTAPRIDWVFNGAYIGQFASDANDFQLRNSKLSTGGFRFFTNPAGSQVERLTILNNGYVGIGVASPVSTLANTSLPIQGSNSTNAYNGGLSWSTSGTGFAASFYSQPSNGNGLLVKIAGNSSSNNAFEVSSSISQESNVNNPINPLFNVKGNGNVGVGTFTPASKLEVNGSATNTSAFSAGSGTTINFANSNLAYTTASAGSFTLSNIKDGGTYTLAVQGATSGTASFTCSGFTFIPVNNGITAPNKHTLYTFIVMGTNVYVYMATGF